MYNNPQDRYKMAASAHSALQRMKNNTQEITESTRTAKTDFARYILEEYDEKTFQDKVKLDTIFYKTMFSKLEEQHSDGVFQVLNRYFDTIKSIYEHVNLKPKAYGFQLPTVFNMSDKEIEESAASKINDYINTQYYSLTQEAREAKYFPTVKQLASDAIIKEHVDERVAVEFGSKAAVLKDLVEKISFPMVIRQRIEQDLLDETYADIFDKDKLKDLWTSFQEQSMDVAKLVAAVI